MKTAAKILKILGFTWLILAAILILIGIIGVWRAGGFGAVLDLLSPFNVANYIATALTLAPGMALLAVSDKLERKALTRKASS